MNLQKLKEQLIADEGRVNFIYSDKDGQPTWPGRKIINKKTGKLEDAGNPTFGIGHKLTPKDPEWYAFKTLRPGAKMLVTEDRIESAYIKDSESAISECCKVFPDFDKILEELQLIIANMMFNLGSLNFSEFYKFILAVKTGNYINAASEMRDSKWWRDEATHNRAERLRKRMMALSICRFINLTECQNVIDEKNSQRVQEPMA